MERHQEMRHRKIVRFFSGWSLILLLLGGNFRMNPAIGQGMPPDLAYALPAGGQAGTSFLVVVGGQRLRGLQEAYVSGTGVKAEVLRHYPPVRRIKPEERMLILEKVSDRVDECWQDWQNRGLVSGKMPWKEKNGLLKEPKPGRKEKTRKDGRKRNLDLANAEIPPHPLLDDIEKKSLKEIEHAFVYFMKNHFMRQLNPQIAEAVLLRVSIAADAPRGNRLLRLYGRRGMSDPVVFQIGDVPEEHELEMNDPDEKGILPPSPSFPVPVVINGRVMPGDVDEFSVKMKGGQMIELELAARELVPYLADAVPGWFQACLSLHDSAGNELALVDDVHFNSDPKMVFRVPADGIYLVRVFDAIFRGREDFVYRLVIRETNPSKQIQEQFRLPPYTGDLPVAEEAVGRISLPILVKGTIDRAGEKDELRFSGRKGQIVVLEVTARRLGSPLDSLVQLFDADQKMIASNDDAVDKKGDLHRGIGRQTHFADSLLRVELPKDGEYLVTISDACRAGSVEHAYYLRVSEPRPDFSLLMTPSAVNLAAGMDTALQIHVLRHDGFNSAIELAVTSHPLGEGDPGDFSVIGGAIPAGADAMNFTIRAPAIKKPNLFRLDITGTGVVNGKKMTRKVRGADDVMQAFLWRHLVPAGDILANVGKNPLGIMPRLVNPTPVYLAPGENVTIDYRAKGLYARRAQVAEVKLLDPPEGLRMKSYQVTPAGLSMTLVYEGEEFLTDNVIPEVFIFRGKQKKNQVSAGYLPGIPVKFGCSDEKMAE
jgi:hypothetical protein